uniref:helix-turn-helix domain-containing protein n=1 Tax=Paractinoplanes polyasparticus TaxID=2856853 RepID=UPI001C853DDE
MAENERVTIADRHRGGCGIRGIATELSRSPSTLSRQVKRNTATHHRTISSLRAQNGSSSPGRTQDLPGPVPGDPARPRTALTLPSGSNWPAYPYWSTCSCGRLRPPPYPPAPLWCTNATRCPAPRWASYP